MNLFYLDNDIKKSCEALADVHLRKMPLESVQMLCTYVYLKMFQGKYPYVSFRKNPDFKGLYKSETGLYLPTHINHPVNIWIRECDSNTIYMLDYTRVLFDEYKSRFSKEHGSFSVFKTCENIILNVLKIKSNGSMTDIKLCMPDEYKRSNFVESYRKYYNSKQQTSKVKLVWSGCNKPEWIS